MKRIDSVNARPDQNGTGKAGFNDNADLSGQDATYITPEWCNHVQEEIANAIEGFDIPLDFENKSQLLSVLVGLSERIDKLDLRVIEDIKVGDLLITTVSFAKGSEVTAHKGYGQWEEYGNGHALVARGRDDSRPNWMRTVNNTGGEDSHQLTVEELPAHSHGYHKALFNYGHKDGGQDASRYGTESGENNAQTSNIGLNQAHNNIQLSMIVGVWIRTA